MAVSRRDVLRIAAGSALLAGGLGGGAWTLWGPNGALTEEERAPLPDREFENQHAAPRTTEGDVEIPDEAGENVIGRRHMTPKTMAKGTLFVPALHAYATIVDEKVVDGKLALPRPRKVGRAVEASGYAQPGGTLLLAGHVASYGTPGALKWLSTLEPGDTAFVTGPDGRRESFKLTGMKMFVKQELPAELWRRSGPRRLVLVTCGGPVIRRPDGRHYRDNVVAYFEPFAAA